MSKFTIRRIVKITQHFFQHISDRKWARADAIIHQIRNGTTTKDEAWKTGYITALQGMLIARKNNHSDPQPFIMQIEACSNLDALKAFFKEQTQHRLNTEFDKGFFRTWYEYTKFLKRP